MKRFYTDKKQKASKWRVCDSMERKQTDKIESMNNWLQKLSFTPLRVVCKLQYRMQKGPNIAIFNSGRRYSTGGWHHDKNSGLFVVRLGSHLHVGAPVVDHAQDLLDVQGARVKVLHRNLAHRNLALHALHLEVNTVPLLPVCQWTGDAKLLVV